MPEQVAPEVEMTEAQFVVPATPKVPTRPGEERFSAGLNLEDSRRRESVIADLQRQLRELGQDSAASEIVARSRVGRAEQQRQRLIRNKVRELQAGNSCPPATVINLNPVRLELYGQLQDLKVPANGEGMQVVLNYRGRAFKGSYVTVATPRVWLKTTGSTNDPTGDRPTFEAKHIAPVGIAHQFYSHYCEGAPDAQHMGGVLIYEGDIHQLEAPQLERAKRKLKVPYGEFNPEDPGEVTYLNKITSIDEYLAMILDAQRNYAELIISQGHGYYTSQSEDERKQLSNRHITWHNYALECGYIKTSYPWASSKLQRTPAEQVIFCPDCRTQQEHPEQYFCRNCNAPFDAFKAFMDGKQVSPDRLAAYSEDSKEWTEIIAEMERRRGRLAMLQGETTKKKRD